MKRTRILFVDDEPNVVEGLRRMLRHERKAWDMAFATRGDEALALLAENPFDVIVTDMAMPGMDGGHLLAKVIETYPDVARIMLSGHAHEETNTQAAKLAHQFLSKPVEPDRLKEAVAHACTMQQLIGNEKLRGAVAGLSTLPSVPQIYVELSNAIGSDASNAKQVAAIIAQDMGMSAKLLQLVNSSFFGIGRRVSSIEQTVTLLGLLRIKALVLTEHVFRMFKPHPRVRSFSIEGLWRHSLQVAELARTLSEAEGQKDDRPDQAFTAALLHDIGILVLASRDPVRYQMIQDRSLLPGARIEEVETEVMEVTHAEIGAYLLGLWGLPPRIVEAVVFHHQPGEILYDGSCAVTMVHVADALLSEVHQPESDLHGYPGRVMLDLDYLERVGLAGRVGVWRELAAKASNPQGVAVS